MRWFAVLVALMSPIAFCANEPISNPKDTVVNILMFDGVQIIDYAAPYEVFAQAGFTIHTVSKDGKSVRATQGLKSEVDHSFATAPAAQIVVVPGGHVHDVQNDAETLAWLRKQAGSAQQVMSVCTGSFILGYSGLLDGGSATTFHRALMPMQQAFPKVKVVSDRRWVDNGKVVTSAGLASGIDTSLHVVAELRGEKVARSVAMTLEYDWKPEGGFVRGAFADRNFRMPSTLRPPKDTEYDMVTSIGDAQTWEFTYLVESSMTPAQLFEQFASQAKQDPAFQVKTNSGPDRLAWEFDSPFGGRWNYSFVAKPGDRPNRYWVVNTLSPAN